MVTVSEPNVIVGIVWLAVALPGAVGAAVLIHRWRDVSSIKARGPYTTHAVNATLGAMVVYIAVHYLVFKREEQLCASGIGFPMITDVGLTLFASRAWILVFRFRIAEVLSQLQSDGNGGEQPRPSLHALLSGPNGWFVRHRWLISRQALLTAFGVNLVVAVVAPGVLVALLDVSCVDKRSAVTYFTAVVTIGYSAALLVLSRFIHDRDRDAFGMRVELRRLGLSAFAMAVVVLPLIATSPERNDSRVGQTDRQLYVNSCVNLALCVVWLFSVVFPLRDAWRASRLESHIVGVERVSTLSELLAVEFGFQSFLRFAHKAFAQENVLFWKAWLDFKHKYGTARVLLDRDEALRDARALAAQYITDSAPYQVNLSSDVREALLNELSHAHAVAASASAASALVSVSTPKASENGSAAGEGVALDTLLAQSDALLYKPPSPHVAPIAGGSSGPPSPVNSSSSSNQAMMPDDAYALAANANHTAALQAAVDILSVFERAATQIYKLMYSDVLPRYLQSAEYADFVRRMQEQAAQAGPLPAHKPSTTTRASAAGVSVALTVVSVSGGAGLGSMDDPHHDDHDPDDDGMANTAAARALPDFIAPLSGHRSSSTRVPDLQLQLQPPPSHDKDRTHAGSRSF